MLFQDAESSIIAASTYLVAPYPIAYGLALGVCIILGAVLMLAGLLLWTAQKFSDAP